jgi:hypothetical protein
MFALWHNRTTLKLSVIILAVLSVRMLTRNDQLSAMLLGIVFGLFVSGFEVHVLS